MPTTDEVLRERVREIVNRTAGTQAEFAVRIGLDSSKLSRSLGGKRRFTSFELARIAEVGRVSLDWLLHGGPAGPAGPAAVDGRSGRESARPDGTDTAPWDQRRGEILAAAWRLIAQRGYHAVRIADIAQVCGTSSAAVHYYFPGKQDVLNEALRYSVEQAFARQSAVLRGIEDGRERLLRLIDMQLPRPGRLRDEWSIWLQFWAEAALRPELRPAHNQFYARWRETVVRIIARGQRQGVFRDDIDAEQAALRFTAFTDGAAIQVLTGAPGVTVEHMRGILLDFVVRELDR
ncbi:MAG TPA: TetR family transcriptional regulator C-terminal domain-containing protein [Pilimelia sp.]|nr:TetR family transcriptional regulator C-terminal domain-containing protein [Pilimelia sp.]